MRPNMASLLKQAQKMQEQLSKAQEELDSIKAEGTSGGGMIKVVANGKQEIESVKIDPEVIDKDDPEMLEDLVLAAVNQAIEKAGEMAKEHMNSMTGGMLGGLPGGLKLPGI
ncbi:YbaB/EbfC family nucleoid-associated protein [candidate division KSB1 bacterium]|nr:YbaB/EbfC family nucleoid-associated protein [candidate division KSB1 bacterium]